MTVEEMRKIGKSYTDSAEVTARSGNTSTMVYQNLLQLRGEQFLIGAEILETLEAIYENTRTMAMR